jgi:DNA-binding NarL/FixJ family response regulator
MRSNSRGAHISTQPISKWEASRPGSPRIEMLRLLIVDDEPAVRKGLQMRFASETDLVVVGEATSGEEALVMVGALRPDVVLMDVELPRMDGIEATRALHTTFPRLPVVMLSVHDDKQTQGRALTAGAFRFVTKRGSNGELLAAIRSAATKAVRRNARPMD